MKDKINSAAGGTAWLGPRCPGLLARSAPPGSQAPAKLRHGCPARENANPGQLPISGKQSGGRSASARRLGLQTSPNGFMQGMERVTSRHPSPACIYGGVQGLFTAVARAQVPSAWRQFGITACPLNRHVSRSISYFCSTASVVSSHAWTRTGNCCSPSPVACKTPCRPQTPQGGSQCSPATCWRCWRPAAARRRHNPGARRPRPCRQASVITGCREPAAAAGAPIVGWHPAPWPALVGGEPRLGTGRSPAQPHLWAQAGMPGAQPGGRPPYSPPRLPCPFAPPLHGGLARPPCLAGAPEAATPVPLPPGVCRQPRGAAGGVQQRPAHARAAGAGHGGGLAAGDQHRCSRRYRAGLRHAPLAGLLPDAVCAAVPGSADEHVPAVCAHPDAHLRRTDGGCALPVRGAVRGACAAAGWGPGLAGQRLWASLLA